MISILINPTKVKSSEGVQRVLYGKYKGYDVYDLNEDWLSMSNDNFFEKYGFNWIPN